MPGRDEVVGSSATSSTTAPGASVAAFLLFVSSSRTRVDHRGSTAPFTRRADSSRRCGRGVRPLLRAVNVSAKGSGVPGRHPVAVGPEAVLDEQPVVPPVRQRVEDDPLERRAVAQLERPELQLQADVGHRPLDGDAEERLDVVRHVRSSARSSAMADTMPVRRVGPHLEVEVLGDDP